MQARHVMTHMLLPCLLLMSTSSSFARDYLVEVVLFENTSGKSASSGGMYIPKGGRAMTLGGDTAQQAGFEVVSDGLSLTENAESIRTSGRFRLLRHLAWRQPGLDNKEAKAIRVNLGSANTVYLPEDTKPYDSFIPVSQNPQPNRTREARTVTLNGTIKVRLGRFLHMDALLVYTDPDTGQSYRLKQSRKMRSRELHYIDNPRFGLLTRILPIDEDEEQADAVAEPIEEIEEAVSVPDNEPATAADPS